MGYRSAWHRFEKPLLLVSKTNELASDWQNKKHQKHDLPNEQRNLFI